MADEFPIPKLGHEGMLEERNIALGERDVARAEIRSLTAALKERDDAIAKLKADVVTMQAEVTSVHDAINTRGVELNDARDQIARLTNERDGLLEKYSPEIAAEKERVAEEAKQAAIAAARATLAEHGADVLPAVIAPDVKA